MPDKGWKQFERRLCRDVGTERIPVTGERAGADGSTAMFCFQFKLRNVFPVYLWEWVKEIAATGAAHGGKVGVLVLKRPHQRDEEALVVLRWKDWLDLHGS